MRKIYTTLAFFGIVLIAIGVIMIVNEDVMALSRSNMVTMNLKRVTSFSRPNNYTSLQASVVTDKYLISIFLDSSKDSTGKNAIVVLNKDNYKKADIGTNPIKKYNFGHANDATYNKNTKEVLILNGEKLYILDSDSLKLKEEKTLDKKYHAIGYDEDNNQYVLATKTDGGTRFHITNTEFSEINSFDIQTNLTRQGLTVHKGYIYYACYEAGKETKYQAKYDGVLKKGENVIYVYDLAGQNKNVFFIPYAYKGIRYNSIQNINFDGEKMIVGFSQNTKAGYFTPDYSSEITKTVKISIDNQAIATVDNSFEATLYQNKKAIAVSKNKDLYYTFKLKFNKTGTYKYTIKQTKVKDKAITSDKEEKTLEVNVYYNPTINSLDATTNAQDIVFTNTKEEVSKEETKVEEKPKEETKVEETPKEETKVEEKPKEEVKVEEAPKEETKVEEKPKEEVKVETPKEESKVEEVPQEEPKMVDVPDTGCNSYLSIIGMILLGFSLFFIKSRKESN